MAPPKPCNTRLATSICSDCAAPQQIEPRVNTAIAEQKVRRMPNRSATQPLIGMNTARLRI